MVDLIALVVGALTLPNIVAEAFLDALIKGLGITVASGMIKKCRYGYCQLYKNTVYMESC